MALRYKKVPKPNENKTPEQALEITIHSDGNVIKLVSYANGVRTFEFTKSKTKLGTLMTMDEKQYERFIYNNSIFKK